MATPIAASIGDVVSLLILSLVASLLYAIHGNIYLLYYIHTYSSLFYYGIVLDTHTYVLFIILGIYIIILLPLWILIVTRNKYTKAVLKHGWVPVISALIISGYVNTSLKHVSTNIIRLILYIAPAD